MPEQPLSADFLTPRRRRPRVDPTLLDWKKLTGEENVSVINRINGKKLTGSKAPQLKRLAQWLLENPMYDVDPKWAELVKERGNLPHDLQKRLPPGDRKKGPGRPPLLSSPPGTNPPVSQASNMQFPSLSGINPSSLLSGLSLGGFDPKNPLLLPFGGVPNMSALSGMSGLSNMNLTNSLFANLAGLGLPGLGIDPSASSSGLTDTTTSMTNVGSSGNSSKQKARNKADSGGGSSASNNNKNTPSSPATSLPSSLPFFFPNPSLLYSPLGLGGLNPFSLQPGTTYDSLALLNGTLGVSSTASSTSNSRTHKGTMSTASRTTSVTSLSPSGASSNSQRNSGVSRGSSSASALPPQQQFMLPQDSHLLENLTRAAAAAAAAAAAGGSKGSKGMSQSAKPKDVAVDSNLRQLMASGTLPMFAQPGAKDILEGLGKSSSDLFSRSMAQQVAPAHESTSKSNKRSRESPDVLLPPSILIKKSRNDDEVKPEDCHELPLAQPLARTKPLQHVQSELEKQLKSEESRVVTPVSLTTKEPTSKQSLAEGNHPPCESLSVSDAPSHVTTTVEPTKTSTEQPVRPTSSPAPTPISFAPSPIGVSLTSSSPASAQKDEQQTSGGNKQKEDDKASSSSSTLPTGTASEATGQQQQQPPTITGKHGVDSGGASAPKEEETVKKKRPPRSKKNAVTAVSDVVERKNLRSSAGRAAAAAAARHRAASLEQQQQQQQQQHEQ